MKRWHLKCAWWELLVALYWPGDAHVLTQLQKEAA